MDDNPCHFLTKAGLANPAKDDRIGPASFYPCARKRFNSQELSLSVQRIGRDPILRVTTIVAYTLALSFYLLAMTSFTTANVIDVIWWAFVRIL